MDTLTSRHLLPLLQVVVFALFLAIGYLYVISGLVVPAMFLFVLWTAWAGLLLVAFQHREDVRFLVATPAAAAVVWLVVVLGLGSLLEWKA